MADRKEGEVGYRATETRNAAGGASSTELKGSGELSYAVVGGQSGWTQPGKSNGTADMYQNRGVYTNFPGMTPNYEDAEQYTSNLRVARLYLSGLSRAGSDVADAAAAGPFSRENLAQLFKKGYVGFFLNQVTEKHTERVELVPLAGGRFQSYFFGESPSMYTFDGAFLNTKQNQWRLLWRKLYHSILRGSQVASHRHLVQIQYDTKIVSGYLTGYTDQLRSENELFSRFQFSMLVVAVHDAMSLEAIMQTSDPFLGDARDFAQFADIKTGDPAGIRSYSDSAHIVPPKRPRPTQRRSGGGHCSFPDARSGSGGETNLVGYATNAVSGKACDAKKSMIAAQKAARKAFAKNKKISKLYNDLTHVPPKITSDKLPKPYTGMTPEMLAAEGKKAADAVAAAKSAAHKFSKEVNAEDNAKKSITAADAAVKNAGPGAGGNLEGTAANRASRSSLPVEDQVQSNLDNIEAAAVGDGSGTVSPMASGVDADTAREHALEQAENNSNQAAAALDAQAEALRQQRIAVRAQNGVKGNGDPDRSEASRVLNTAEQQVRARADAARRQAAEARRRRGLGTADTPTQNHSSQGQAPPGANNGGSDGETTTDSESLPSGQRAARVKAAKKAQRSEVQQIARARVAMQQ